MPPSPHVSEPPALPPMIPPMPLGKHDPAWPALVAQWKQTQNALRARLLVRPLSPLPLFVAGAAGAFSDDKRTVFAAAVVYAREAGHIVEVAHAPEPADVLYIPGFLSFRE